MSKMIFNGLEFVAGQEINNNGMFVDTSNVIVPTTTFTSSMSYTATSDCIVALSLTTMSSSSVLVKIDGVIIQSGYIASGNNSLGYSVNIKKGQVLTISGANSSSNSAYTVYGLQSGSISNVQHNYSTSEQLIGTWIDGKPLYERTKVVSFANFTHNNDTYFTPIASDNTETLRNVEAIAYSTGYGVCTLGSRAYSRDNTLSYYWELVEYYSNVALHFVGESVTDVGVTEVVITYRYTKTTD